MNRGSRFDFRRDSHVKGDLLFVVARSAPALASAHRNGTVLEVGDAFVERLDGAHQAGHHTFVVDAFESLDHLATAAVGGEGLCARVDESRQVVLALLGNKPLLERIVAGADAGVENGRRTGYDARTAHATM